MKLCSEDLKRLEKLYAFSQQETDLQICFVREVCLVAETHLRARALSAGFTEAERGASFFQYLDWLDQRGFIDIEDHGFWDMLRQLRNDAFHAALQDRIFTSAPLNKMLFEKLQTHIAHL